MIAVDGHKANWMQIPYPASAIPNNPHLPPPPSLNPVPSNATTMQSDMKPYLGDETIAGGQMAHIGRQMPPHSAGHSPNTSSSASSKAAQDRVKRPMNAFMVRIIY